MLKKILAVLAGIGAALSAVFYVLFRQAKKEKNAINEKYDNMSENTDALKRAEEAEKKVKKENEELKKKINSSNNLDSFDACNDLLSK
jgi:predicted Holliday junction resolvase-like endonuclease